MITGRSRTLEDHRARVTKVMVHIQENLGADLSVTALARIAALAPFHFHRVFTGLVGEPVHRYVRRTRIERAAFDLVWAGKPVSQVAATVGYRTQPAFIRAFRSVVGVSPSVFRGSHETPPFIDDPQADAALAAARREVVSEPARRLLFVRRAGRIGAATAEAQRQLRSLVREALLHARGGLVGICPDYPPITPADRMRYDAGVFVEGPIRATGEMAVQSVAAGPYLVFSLRPPTGDAEEINRVWRCLYLHWLRANGYRVRSTGAYEFYPQGLEGSRPGGDSVELHVPLDTR